MHYPEQAHHVDSFHLYGLPEEVTASEYYHDVHNPFGYHHDDYDEALHHMQHKIGDYNRHHHGDWDTYHHSDYHHHEVPHHFAEPHPEIYQEFHPELNNFEDHHGHGDYDQSHYYGDHYVNPHHEDYGHHDHYYDNPYSMIPHLYHDVYDDTYHAIQHHEMNDPWQYDSSAYHEDYYGPTHYQIPVHDAPHHIEERHGDHYHNYD